MIGCNTIREISLTLEQTYSKSNTTKIMQLKEQLWNLKKGSHSIKDYTTKVKNLVLALNELGCPISWQEHTVYILSELGSEYNHTVSAISVKSKSKPPQETISLLMGHESKLERNSLINADSTQHTTNLVFLKCW